MAIPNVKTRTAHQIAIRVDGKTIGFIQDWNTGMGRDATHVFELNPQTSGTPVDVVPGNVSGLQIEVNRIDLNSGTMEEVFGGTDLDMLSKQENAFEVHEVWTEPTGATRHIVYHDCWFTNIQRTASSTGDRIITARGTMAYRARQEI